MAGVSIRDPVRSVWSNGIWRQGVRSFCKKFLCINTMPCRHMPFLVHSWISLDLNRSCNGRAVTSTPADSTTRQAALGLAVLLYVNTYIYIYTYIYICIYVYIYIYTHVILVYMCVYIYIYICICMCVYVYVYIYIYMIHVMRYTHYARIISTQSMAAGQRSWMCQVATDHGPLRGGLRCAKWQLAPTTILREPYGRGSQAHHAILYIYIYIYI